MSQVDRLAPISLATRFVLRHLLPISLLFFLNSVSRFISICRYSSGFSEHPVVGITIVIVGRIPDHLKLAELTAG
jgi:hypothetical protein